ncbi:serine/threonine protein phosphatase [Sporosarcina sp. PTS2304]|uniref:SpoIIE family protein phosphatase n=1 Tax=Sporosarcina sp. PTS2304 TaxID=2283194 RepID=UPI000E0D377B|nr:SpoIIE family protein phosphatase [Sporosarcina sp. PTS2304]AXI00740.1 serine/threonine protein phosphatase [Sporosarcina sp. PTS2304]
MKMIDNIERPFGQQIREPWQWLINRKVYILTAILFLVGSFFLSQAVVFDMAVPFFLPIWALASMRYRQHMIYVFIGGMIGSSFLGMGQAVIHLTQLLLFHTAIKIPVMKKSIPVAVAASMILPQIVWQLIQYSERLPVAVQLSIGLEALLALFMTIFMLLAFPSIDRLLYGPWNPEQVSAMCIVGALATTGMGGVQIGYVSVAGVFLFLAIYVAAMVGGVPFATTVGMIIALIIGVSDLAFTGMMALYGITGLMAGGLKRFGKVGVITGSVFVSVFFLLYDATLPLDTVHFSTIGIASLLFLFIPTQKMNRIRQVLLPKQEGISEKRQQWLADKLDGQLEEFQQFAHFMSTLVSNRLTPEDEAAATVEVPSICQSCFRYRKCWESEEDGIGELIGEWESTYSATKKAARVRVEERMKFKCLRFKGLINELEEHGTNRLLMGQLQHGRKMLALQLRDMSMHIEKVMREVKEDLTTYKMAEEELANRLQVQGVEFFQIDILSEERGSCRVVVSVPEKKADFEAETTVGEYLIVPVLEQMYEEPIYISKSTYQPFPFPHVQLTFSSAVRFSLDYDIVTTTGRGAFQGGDAYEVFKIHDGLSAVLLSDGMGQDINAYHESRKVIRLMRECLGQKMDPETAIHTLHYMMALNGLDDMYATLDLALIDLQDGRLWSWKAGSMSTYIKRGDECIRLDSKTVPFGFLPSFSIEAKNEQLKSGDIIVMMTDGIFNGELQLEVQEDVMHQTIDRFKEMDCHTIADQVMMEMERVFETVDDDRTVLVMKVDHIVPKWSKTNKKSKVSSS